MQHVAERELTCGQNTTAQVVYLAWPTVLLLLTIASSDCLQSTFCNKYKPIMEVDRH